MVFEDIFLTFNIRVRYMDNLVKLSEKPLRPNGYRGFCISLPETFFKERGLRVGDVINFFAAPDSDDLILRPVKVRKPSVS